MIQELIGVCNFNEMHIIDYETGEVIKSFKVRAKLTDYDEISENDIKEVCENFGETIAEGIGATYVSTIFNGEYNGL
jgi:hypothetical protein